MRRYPAKLLLFGEHVVLLGAPALAVPIPRFGGQWAWRDPAGAATERDGRLRQFARGAELAAVRGLDAVAFARDLEKGLFFDSDIPSGYGLGSSGALCAAVYDRYCLEKTDDPAALKAIFAGMESFFHGSSSGIDPLTSYLDQPVIVRNKTEVSAGRWPRWEQGAPLIFLVDSRLPRRTAPLVQWFQERSREPAFAEVLKERYLPFHNGALRGWEMSDKDLFMQNIYVIGSQQHRFMRPLFPPTLLRLWDATFAADTSVANVRLKLCGAGGGGFVLGFAHSREPVERIAQFHEVVFPFEQNFFPA